MREKAREGEEIGEEGGGREKSGSDCHYKVPATKNKMDHGAISHKINCEMNCGLQITHTYTHKPTSCP